MSVYYFVFIYFKIVKAKRENLLDCEFREDRLELYLFGYFWCLESFLVFINFLVNSRCLKMLWNG